jgi:hypothetical protein
MLVNSDEEETIDKELMEYYLSRRMSDKELMEYLKAVQAKTGKTIHLDSAKPRDPNRPPKQCAKLGSNDEAQQPNASEQAAEPTAAWDWHHSTAQPKQSTEPVKGPKLTAPVKGPESPAPMQKN